MIAVWNRGKDRWFRWLGRARKRSEVVDVLSESVSRYRQHRLGRVSALLAHYGFLSVFPLIVSFTAILGFVLQGNERLQHDIVDSTLSNLPVVGQQLESDPGSLRGNGVVLAFSLLLAVWAGIRAFAVAQTAVDDIDGVPHEARLAFVHGRLRALATVAVIGLAQVVTAVVAAILASSPIAAVAQVPLLALTAVVDIVLVGIAYRLLSSLRHPWRRLRPGSIFAGIGFATLQLIGSLVVGRAITKSTPVYGTFATVIGLLSWLSLHALVALIGYQLNVVLEERAMAHEPA